MKPSLDLIISPQLYPPEDQEEEDDERLTLEERKEKFIRRTGRDLACKLACIFISQPLHVITIRAMAEFIGGEEQYSGGLTAGIVNGVQSIIQENGILGFWSGLVPRALGELGIVGLTAGLTFAVNNYLVEDKDMKSYTRHVASFLAGSLFYPLQVTSSCMTVSRSGLVAGYPPNMPFYTSWNNCFSHLRAQGQLKRGSSLFFRYYTGPQVMPSNTQSLVLTSSIAGHRQRARHSGGREDVQVSSEEGVERGW